MAEIEQYYYRTLSLTDFIGQYEATIPMVRLFELTLPWLSATEKFMLPENSQVIVHCLFHHSVGQEQSIAMAWPLIHQSGKNCLVKSAISSLSSFYSSVAEPLFFNPPTKNMVNKILYYISKENDWHSLQLGSFEDGIIVQSLKENFPYLKVFSTSENIYQTSINDFMDYYQQRPSQLRNTIKRRERKLAKTHLYRTEIITTLDKFPLAFEAYKSIYQQSWKGDEFSFAFIEQVCLAALAENKLRLGLLYVDEEPVAAQLWFLQLYSQDDFHGTINTVSSEGENKLESWQTTASIFKLAYIPEYQQFSVGSILSLALSEHVIIEDKVSSIEFGMGSEAYKKDWLTEVRTRYIYQIFNPRSFYGKLFIVRQVLLPRLINFLTGKVQKQ